MTYYVLDGNWTSAVSAEVGNNSGSYLYPINTSVSDPAVGCEKKTFYASYQCGKDKKVRNVPSILDAVGQTALFDCTDLYDKCNGLTLNLGDDGILTIKDKSDKPLWDSTKAKSYSALPTDKILALDEYKPILSDGTNNPDSDMFANRSYLNAGEFLEPGQYIGSPNGTCRLEMVGSETAGNGRWVTVTLPYTTSRDKVLTRLTFKNWKDFSYIIVVPTKGTVLPNFGSNYILEVATATNEPWITIGTDKKYLFILNWPQKSASYNLRYGNFGKYAKKNYTNKDYIFLWPVNAGEFASFTKVGNEGSTVTVEGGGDKIFRYGHGNRWVTKAMSGTFTANNSTFGDPAPDIGKEIQVSTTSIPAGTDEKPNKVQIQMFESAPSGSALQVVFNTVGCTDELPITALNNESSRLYTIPKTERDSLGKIGYVNEYGQLNPYNDPSMIANYSAYFKPLSNADNSTYGMYGNDLGNPINVASKDECKELCKFNPISCAGFQYESVKKVCQLKSEGVTKAGIRISNPTDGSVNYQYYSRMKDITGLDASCPSKVEDTITGSPSDWAGFSLGAPIVKTTYNADGTVNTQGTQCGLVNAVKGQRKAALLADLSLNTFKGQLSGTIKNLYDKYQSLKNILSTNQSNLDDTMKELIETKKNAADWSGEEMAQLDAMNEDRELNKQSQNYKHIMWTILAIIAIFVIIKLTKYLGGSSSASSASGSTAGPSASASASGPSIEASASSTSATASK